MSDEELFLKKVGQNIRDRRNKLGLTLDELGALCEIEKSNLIPIEKGKTNITLKTLLKISLALATEPRDILI